MDLHMTGITISGTVDSSRINLEGLNEVTSETELNRCSFDYPNTENVFYLFNLKGYGLLFKG